MTAQLAVPAPTHTGQATQIEQARAQAEVLAAMEAAKRWPRDEDACEAKMRRACARPLVADKAFWAFPRGGEQLTGSTIHLATTLAGIWGNMQFGVVELERNTGRRESQMLAVAWELETNTRATTTFLVPHVRDTRSGKKDLTDLRDVYENNANQGARRVREMIFKILPDWYTETAEDTCRATLEKSDKPIDLQRAAIAKAFDNFDVTTDQLAAKVGRDWDETTPSDLAILRIIGKSIRRGETTVREQFTPATPAAAPATAVTVEELIGAPASAPPSSHQPDEPVAGEDAPSDDAALASAKQNRHMHGLFREAELGGKDDRDARLQLTGLLLGRQLDTSAGLTGADADAVIDALIRLQNSGHADGLAGAAADLLNEDDLRREAAAEQAGQDQAAGEQAAADDDARAES